MYHNIKILRLAHPEHLFDNIAALQSLMKEWRNIPLNLNFSAIENFEYQTWRDFSDLRLIEPSRGHPIIEVEIALNFFPGDHFTAER